LSRKRAGKSSAEMRRIMSQNFIYSLEIMGKGMLSIFAVILLLMLVVTLIPWLEKLINKPKEKKEN
jgi:hypothetical protein